MPAALAHRLSLHTDYRPASPPNHRADRVGRHVYRQLALLRWMRDGFLAEAREELGLLGELGVVVARCGGGGAMMGIIFGVFGAPAPPPAAAATAPAPAFRLPTGHVDDTSGRAWTERSTAEQWLRAAWCGVRLRLLAAGCGFCNYVPGSSCSHLGI